MNIITNSNLFIPSTDFPQNHVNYSTKNKNCTRFLLLYGHNTINSGGQSSTYYSRKKVV